MTALAQARGNNEERFTKRQYTLASGNKGYEGGVAVLDMSTQKVEPGHAESDLLFLGKFERTVDATSADKLCTVHFGREVVGRRYVNATSTDALASTDIGALCYIVDDQTVGKLAHTSGTPRIVAGRVWEVDATRGVLVEALTGAGPSNLKLLTIPAYVSNDSVVVEIVSGAIYDVPTTGAASTISLPTAAALPDGINATFTADGTKNGHTVQVRDVTTAITAALTASKRLTISVFTNGGKWFAIAHIAP